MYLLICLIYYILLGLLILSSNKLQFFYNIFKNYVCDLFGLKLIYTTIIVNTCTKINFQLNPNSYINLSYYSCGIKNVYNMLYLHLEQFKQ